MSARIDGVAVGHWTDAEAMTGCTVVLLPAGNVASGEIRGAAPATHDFGLLDPLRTVQSVDAIVLSGGSAFGLNACGGVIDGLSSLDRGYETSKAKVPIVVGMSLYDLGVGSAETRPSYASGSIALAEALMNVDGDIEVGRIGAGTGATTGNWRGPDEARPGGIGLARLDHGDVFVACLVAVNAIGDVDDGTGAARVADDPSSIPDPPDRTGGEGENTTIGVIFTSAALDKSGCHLLAQAAHDGLARAVYPAHTSADGDAFVAVSIGDKASESLGLRALAIAATERAIRFAAH